MLTTAAFIYMLVDGLCSPVVLAIIMFREFAVAGVRMIAAGSGTVIAANMWGKVKTVLQMVTVLFYYFVPPFMVPPTSWLSASSLRCCAGWWRRSRCSPAVSTCGRTAAVSCRQNKPLGPCAAAAAGL